MDAIGGSPFALIVALLVMGGLFALAMLAYYRRRR